MLPPGKKTVSCIYTSYSNYLEEKQSSKEIRVSIGRDTIYTNLDFHLSKNIEKYTTLEKCSSYFNLAGVGLEGSWIWQYL